MKRIKVLGLQEVAQSIKTTLNEADVTSSNLPPPILCGHVKKKKKKRIKVLEHPIKLFKFGSLKFLF